MTAEIRDLVRRNRKRGALVAVGGVLVAALIAVVVPAFAAVGDSIPPASSPGNVLPTEINNGGQNNDCAFVGSQAPISWRIENPTTSTRTQTYNGKPVTLALEMSSGGKLLEFAVTGAVARDVVVKGGTNSTWYAYTSPRSTDGNLHAPRKSANTLYQISQTTFCLAQVGTIEGTVFQDSNESGIKDSFESPQRDWTVTLYANGSPVAAVPKTGSDGSYKFENQPLGVEYTVCEAPPTSSPSWGQTVPSPANSFCAGIGAGPTPQPEQPAGQRLTLNTASVTANFGNVPVSTAACNSTAGYTGYQFQRNCAGEPTKTFVVSTWIDANGDQVVNLHPTAHAGSAVPIVEKITWSFTGNSQNPINMVYDDTFPYGDQTRVMKLCVSDPRDTEFTVPAGTTGVLPAGETSCMLASTDSAGGTYVAYVYTEVDGLRGVG